MPEVDERELRRAAETNFNARARFVERTRVVERFEGKTVWDGVISTFSLDGCPLGTRCYAWSHEIPGKTERRFITVLATPKINTPLAALRAALVDQFKKGQ